MSIVYPLPSNPPAPFKNGFWKLAKDYFDVRRFEVSIEDGNPLPNVVIRIFRRDPDGEPNDFALDETISLRDELNLHPSETLIGFLFRLVRRKKSS